MKNDRRTGERRRVRSGFRLHERRSGFDRRRSEEGGLSAYYRRLLRLLREDSAILIAILAATNLLNLMDFLLTLHALERGAQEANPLMRTLLSMGPWAAGVFKLLIVLAASVLIWRFRRFKPVLEAGVLALALLGLVFVYQVAGRLLI
ncbi:MAG: hypothetical protein Kow00129_03440 [Thermoleophilia bacterium]